MELKYLQCKLCNKKIAEAYVQNESTEVDLNEWKLYETYYSFRVCKDCAISYLENELKFATKNTSELMALCKKRKTQIEKLETTNRRLKKYINKVKASLNGFCKLKFEEIE